MEDWKMGKRSNTVIRARELSRRFGDIVAVDGLSLEVYAGEVFGFLGHNGAGKTTTVRLMNGVLDPTGGEVTVFGLTPSTDGPALRRRTGVLTETPSLDERLTGRENLSIYADLYGVAENEVASRVNAFLDEFGLSERGAGDLAGGRGDIVVAGEGVPEGGVDGEDVSMEEWKSGRLDGGSLFFNTKVTKGTRRTRIF